MTRQRPSSFGTWDPLTDEDERILAEYEKGRPVRFYLQPAGLDSVHSLTGENGQNLSYRLDNHDVTIEFSPTDFTQINFDLNPLMVDQVISLLDLSAGDTVLDLFCGSGNFTLPIARYVKTLPELRDRKSWSTAQKRTLRKTAC